jgi:hypothetical protein
MNRPPPVRQRVFVSATVALVSLLLLSSAAAFARTGRSGTEQSAPGLSPWQAPRIVADGFAQDGGWINYSFIVENPNLGVALNEVSYEVVVADDQGAILGANQSFVWLLTPGQRLAVANAMAVAEGERAGGLFVRVRSWHVVPTDPLQATDVGFVADEVAPRVTGRIASAFPSVVDNVRVSALAFDSDGAIIGAGHAFIARIDPGGSSAIEVPIITRGVPARVELHPALTSLSTSRQ